MSGTFKASGIDGGEPIEVVILDWGGVCEGPTGVDPEAVRFIDDARARGLTLVVLSNELDNGRIGTEPALVSADAVVNLAAAAITKPDRRAFLRAALAVGADPARCLVVDDTELNLAGAVAAGMRARRFDPDDPSRSWSELRRVLSMTPP